MKVEIKYGWIVVNNKYYEERSEDGKTTYVEVDKKDVKQQERKANDIIKKLSPYLDKEKVLKESILTLHEKSLNQLYNLLFKSKIKYKPKTRAGRCVDMKIGGFILPIID